MAPRPKKPAFDVNWKSFRAIRPITAGGKDFQLGDPVPEGTFLDSRRRKQMYDLNRMWPVDEGAPTLKILEDYDERTKPIDLAAISWLELKRLARKLGFKGQVPTKVVLEDYVRGHANVVSAS